jgi:hypothetical protein
MYPTPYTITTSFSQDVTNNVAGRNTVRPDRVDLEYQNIQTSLNAVITNLMLIQRSDNALKDGVVTMASLNASVLSLFSSPLTLKPRGAWLTATAYAINDVVETGSPLGSYVCLIAHTSGVFATDKANGDWMLYGALISPDPTFNTVTATTITATSLVGLLTTAAQTNITSLGVLTALSISGALTLTAAVSKLVPGATSFSIRNHADAADNLLIADSGAITVRSTISGVTTLTATSFVGAVSTAAQPAITSVGTLTALTVSGNITAQGEIVMSAGTSKMVPGATSFSVRNNADSQDNLLVSNAGDVAIKGALTFGGVLTPTFDSGDLTLTANSLAVVSHGLGRLPKLVHAVIRCTTTDLNYSVGDEVSIYESTTSGTINGMCGASATQLFAAIGTTLSLADKSTFANSLITFSKWKLVLRCWG